MPLVNVRELIPFGPGDNSTDTVINGVHFNSTALKHFNYTMYSNGTLSNISNCLLILPQYQPHMLSNGSWINTTSCYTPLYGLGSRAAASIALGTAFGFSIMFTLINLGKHGKLHLREDKRFRIVGRRWQWYWMCFVAACAMISCFTGVDVDRYYLPSLPIILQGFFSMLMLNGILATVWEATRHWGSWQERQIVDIDPYALPDDDRRSKVEFFLPLVFYAFDWLNFFMVIPRSWTKIELQRSPEQQAIVAKPSATDIRHKIGSIMAAVCLGIICFSLSHSLKHYRPPADPGMGKFTNLTRRCPPKLLLAIAILAVRVAYQIACAWIWDLTILNKDVNPLWPFIFGYGTTLLIIIIFEVGGYLDQNEDTILIRRRRERGIQADQELGIVRKPNWWRRNYAEAFMSDDQKLRNMAHQGPGGDGIRQTKKDDAGATNIELKNMAGVRNRSRNRMAAQEQGLTTTQDPFRDPSPASAPGAHLQRPSGQSRTESDNASTLTGMSGTTRVEQSNPQKIRSMLDI